MYPQILIYYILIRLFNQAIVLPKALSNGLFGLYKAYFVKILYYFTDSTENTMTKNLLARNLGIFFCFLRLTPGNDSF